MKLNQWEFCDRFVGHRVYSATAGSNVGHNWLIADTSSSGTPTYAPVTPGRGVKVDMASTGEIENVCLYMGDILNFDIDEIKEVQFRIAMNQAAMDATSQIAIGMASARNAAIDSIAAAALFRVIGADDTTAIVVETDDGTLNNDDVATGQTLINTFKTLTINFATGKNDVRFFVDGIPVAQSTTFDMSNYSGGLQPLVQIQKTSDTNIDGFTLQDFKINGRSYAA